VTVRGIRGRFRAVGGLGAACAIVILGCGSGVAGESGVPAEATMGLPLLLHETFPNGRSDRWHPTDRAGWETMLRGDRWVYALVGACRYEPPVRAPVNISILREPAVTDFIFEVRLRSTTKDYAHRDMCIVFGYQDPSHMYYAHLGKEADPHSNSIFIVDATPRVSIATYRTQGTPWDDEPHWIRVRREANSGSIEVYFDDPGRPVMRAQDTAFDWGHVGVGAFDDTGEVLEATLWGTAADKRGVLP